MMKLLTSLIKNKDLVSVKASKKQGMQDYFTYPQNPQTLLEDSHLNYI